MRFWKKAPAVEAVGTSGEIIKKAADMVQQVPKSPEKFEPTPDKEKEKDVDMLPEKGEKEE